MQVHANPAPELHDGSVAVPHWCHPQEESVVLVLPHVVGDGWNESLRSCRPCPEGALSSSAKRFKFLGSASQNLNKKKRSWTIASELQVVKQDGRTSLRHPQIKLNLLTSLTHSR